MTPSVVIDHIQSGSAALPVRGAGMRGGGLVEYALLVALIAIACFVAVQVLGTSTSTSFSRTGASVGAV